jgi:hypothetical protein
VIAVNWWCQSEALSVQSNASQVMSDTNSITLGQLPPGL